MVILLVQFSFLSTSGSQFLFSKKEPPFGPQTKKKLDKSHNVGINVCHKEVFKA